MGPRKTTDALVSNGVVSGNFPNFKHGFSNLFSTYLTSQMQVYEKTHGKNRNVQYKSLSCNNEREQKHLELCGSTNTLGR